MTAPWRDLIESFADGRIDAPAFEQAFLELWRAERDAGRRYPYAVEIMFGGVDAYCADPSLLGPLDITEAQLREEAWAVLDRWDEPWPPLPPMTAADIRNAKLLQRIRTIAENLGETRK